MPNILQNKSIRRAVWVTCIILGLAIVITLMLTGRHYFTRRGIREIQFIVNSYGTLSPLVIFFLILISTIIPPLPIPTPLVEMAAGYIYGFWPSFFLVWISQIISSLAAYSISRYVGKRMFKKVLNNPIVAFYQAYIKEHGAIAVFVTRSTMSSPLSIVSFLSGFTDMSTLYYTLATIFGTIVESSFYSFIGSVIRGTRLRLWFVFILVVVLGALGPLLTYLVMKLISKSKKKTIR